MGIVLEAGKGLGLSGLNLADCGGGVGGLVGCHGQGLGAGMGQRLF